MTGLVTAPVEDVATQATRALREFLDRQTVVLHDVSPALAPAAAALRDAVLGGGKLLRPSFCYWGWRAAAGSPDDPCIITAAAGLELLHAGALIHDDIMDGSDTRRGRPAMHRRFGAAVAILLGDWCMAWCDEMVDRSGLPEDRLRPARRLLHLVHTELIAGQYLDVLGHAGEGGLDRARTVIRYKTAKYTIERPLQLGALLAGADADLLAACSAFALPLGEAFQLRDDVLGVFGDPAVTGKPSGDDLREGKATVLIELTRQRATAEQRVLVDRLLGDRALDDAGVATLRDLILRTGALAAVEQLIDRHARTALRTLTEAPFTAAARTALAALAVAATSRAT